LKKAVRKLEKAKHSEINKDHENVPGALINSGLNIILMDQIKNINDKIENDSQPQ
jgi:hypothetical protein